MSAEEAFEIWAPVESPWSPWVKPVLFAYDPDWDASRDPDLHETADLSWLDAPPPKVSGYREARSQSPNGDTTTAMIVDLPGSAGVPCGIGLARRGWRPIPLYNSIPGTVPGSFAPSAVSTPQPALGGVMPFVSTATALVEVAPIVVAMRRATSILAELALPATRPPVFLLDANRRVGVGPPAPGRLDNRSISLPTDFPSAVFLRSHGISRVVLLQALGTAPQEDLAHTLRAWQEGGVAILVKSVGSPLGPVEIEVTRPGHARAFWYRFLATMGLRRSPLGGFGGTIPVPSAG